MAPFRCRGQWLVLVVPGSAKPRRAHSSSGPNTLRNRNNHGLDAGRRSDHIAARAGARCASKHVGPRRYTSNMLATAPTESTPEVSTLAAAVTTLLDADLTRLSDAEVLDTLCGIETATRQLGHAVHQLLVADRGTQYPRRPRPQDREEAADRAAAICPTPTPAPGSPPPKTWVPGTPSPGRTCRSPCPTPPPRNATARSAPTTPAPSAT